MRDNQTRRESLREAAWQSTVGLWISYPLQALAWTPLTLYLHERGWGYAAISAVVTGGYWFVSTARSYVIRRMHERGFSLRVWALGRLALLRGRW